MLGSAAWSYDDSTNTVTIGIGSVDVHSGAVVTVAGAQSLGSVAEPTTTDLTLDPSTTVALAPGASTTVTANLTDGGPSGLTGVQLSLQVPSGWSATPTTSLDDASLAVGDTDSASWTVTAPSSATGISTAELSAKATYTIASTGTAGQVTATQTQTPVVTSVSPQTAEAGEQVTITGTNFGASQGDGFVTFSDDGTNWGAPGDEATFNVDSWSNNSITFTVPEASGTNGQWAVTPGSVATITVTTDAGASSPQTVEITAPGAPMITASSPTSASAGTQVTITGQNFGATQGSSYVKFFDAGVTWGAPGDVATFQVDSWSNDSVTFTVPEPSVANNTTWAITPGTTATVNLVTSVGSSSTVNLPLTGS